MKPRLMACVALVSLAIVGAALSARMALAQAPGAGGGPQGQQSDQDRGGQRGPLSEQIDKALQAYEERLERNLDQCRKELDQMKKELHELIDLRINMALSLAELRAKSQMHGGGSYASQRPVAEGDTYRSVAEGARRGGGPRRGEGSGLTRELQQIHNQLRSEIDQQQNQISQLATQLRGLQPQTQPDQQPGQSQEQGQGQQGGTRGPRDREGRRGQRQQPGQPSGRPQSNNPGQGGGQPGGRSLPGL
jgi:hypothetical protein